MTHASLFSGIGGFDLAARWAGWTNAFNCEIDPFCRRVLKYHFPDATQYADIRTTDFSVWAGRIGVLTGGFPCFTAKTKILTSNGYKAIKDVRLGDRVLTDKGRFMPVNALMNKKTQSCVHIKAQGIDRHTITTPNHPFWIKKKAHPFARKYSDRYLHPAWVKAGEISKGDLIAYRCIDGDLMYKTKSFWYLIGRYLGDGWILDGKRVSKIPQGKRGSRVTSKNWKVVICCHKNEKDSLKSAIESAGYKCTISEDRSTYRFIISSKELTTFLYGFGRYSYGKKLSGMCFNLTGELKKSLFRGWLDSDGYTEKNGAFKVTTVSEDLAYGMAQIARDCFKMPVSISRKSVSRNCMIEGRSVAERPQYCVTVSNSNRYGYYENGFVWCLVKDVKTERVTTEVFNIGVIEDETYTANGITVHNCQPFSVAGKRRGTEDSRHLWPEMLRTIREVRPRWVVGENVRGIVSWNGGMVFEQVCADLETEGYEVLPFVLPACSVGAPHRRDRVWFVAHRTDTGPETVREGADGLLSDAAAADADGERRTEYSASAESGETNGRDCAGDYEIPDWEQFPTESPVCSGDDGFPAGLDGITVPRWRAESTKAYGNAIVPQVAYQIFTTINTCM